MKASDFQRNETLISWFWKPMACKTTKVDFGKKEELWTPRKTGGGAGPMASMMFLAEG